MSNKDEKMKKITRYFRYVLKKNNMSTKYYDLNSSDIKVIKISYLDIIKQYIKNRTIMDGYYDYINNYIYLNSNKITSSIYHELFHLASRKDANNIGFDNLFGEHIVGTGLNEGYTEILTARYFNKDINSYDLETKCALMIESIVGKEKMQELYMKADLMSLIEELSKYKDEDTIIELMYDLDYVNSALYRCVHNDKLQKEVVIKIKHFCNNINEIYLIKFEEEYKVNKEQAVDNLNKYLSYTFKLRLGSHKYEFNDYDKFNEKVLKLGGM